MRRRTTLALAGGTLAAVAAGAVVLGRRRSQEPKAPPSGEDVQFTLFGLGGPQGFWFNGPIGRAFAKFQPIGHAHLYDVVAGMLDPRG